jgi:hypothetical protein
VSGSENLRTLSGETQRIATEAITNSGPSRNELVAAVHLFKAQRNDERKEAARLRAALIYVERLLLQSSSIEALREIRAALEAKP